MRYLIAAMIFIAMLTNVSDANFRKDARFRTNVRYDVDHTDPVVFFEHYRVQMPSSRIPQSEFTLNIAILNANQRYEHSRVEGFQIDFRYDVRYLDCRGAVIPQAGLYSQRAYEDDLRANIPRQREWQWFQSRGFDTHNIHSVSMSTRQGFRRSAGILAGLKFVNESIWQSGIEPWIEIVRVQLFLDNGQVEEYVAPHFSAPPNSIRVFNTRILRRLDSKDVDFDGKLNYWDLSLLINEMYNGGEYLNRLQSPTRARDTIDILRGMDLDRNWIIDGDDLRKLSCYIDNRKKKPACEFIFGRLKAVKAGK